MKSLDNPGGAAFYSTMTAAIKPIASIQSKTKKQRNEIDVASIHICYDGDDIRVWTAIEELLNATTRFSAYSHNVHLTIDVGKMPGRSCRHRLAIGKDGIAIESDTPYGAARAIRRVVSRLAFRRAPYLKMGEWSDEGTIDPALTHLAFKPDNQHSLDWPEPYHENYLRRIAAAGFTGFHLNVNLPLFCHSELLPEMNGNEYEKNLEDLRKIVAQADKFGLGVYLSLYLEAIPGDHPVFKNHPELRGSRFVTAENMYILCSSMPLTRQFYAEQMRNLLTDVPGLAGIVAICGCEGWLHCHTANVPDSCPNCAGKDTEAETAATFNAMAAAVKATDPCAKFVVWTYGIFAWTDIRAEKFISHLSKDCTLMANFDTGDDFQIGGASSTYFDYSLSCVGPSTPFIAQKCAAEARGLEVWAKIESGAPLEYCSLQYVPAMQRWERKYAATIANASGSMMAWKFLGYNGGLAQELAGLFAMGEGDGALDRLAIREFGKDASKAKAAWREFDRAMDFHPFSNQSAGYFMGPFFIGPAQPLFMRQPREVPDIFMNVWANRPVWMTDLVFVEPFGVTIFRRALRKMEAHMEKACEFLQGIDNHHADVCRMFLCFIRTALNMVDFYAERERFHLLPYTPQKASEMLADMREIAKRELANAEEALELLRRHPFMATSYIYRPGITENMLLWKIKHTKRLIEHDIPFSNYCIRFSRNRHPELL